MLLNFELSPGCLNSAKSLGRSASTSVAAIDAGRPCSTLTRLCMKDQPYFHFSLSEYVSPLNCVRRPPKSVPRLNRPSIEIRALVPPVHAILNSHFHSQTQISV